MERSEPKSNVMAGVAWIAFAVAAIALTVAAAAFLGKPKPVTLTPPSIGSGESRPDLDVDRIRADIRHLSSHRSRVTGSRGADETAEWLRENLRELGARDITLQTFTTPVPVSEESYLTLSNGAGTVRIPVYPLWPNLARTCQTPPEGITGPVVDVGSGKEAELKGKEIADAVVLMDWDTNLEWLGIPEFGAAAVVYRGNDDATGYTARNKFLTIPADIPRYYVDTADLATLDAAIKSPKTSATVHCNVSWKRVTGTNILARVNDGSPEPAEDPQDARPIIFHAYYDSISVVPDLAPGAEQACGAATVLGVARYFSNAETRRPVWVLFTAGHGQALTGMMDFTSRLRQDLKQTPVPPGTPAAVLGTPGLFVGIDLSTGSDSYGVFAIGRFRQQAEHKLRPKFSVLGVQLADYASTILTEERRAAGRTPESEEEPEKVEDAALVDCINLTRGRGWWTYFPYQAAFESEIPVVAGFPAITVGTVNDDRRYVDTPGDTFERLRLDRLARQIKADPGNRVGLAAIAEALTQWSGPFVSKPLDDVWSTLSGRVVWLDQERNYTPNEPLNGALVFMKTLRGDKHLMGTRGIPAIMTDAKGEFLFDGLIPYTENWSFRNCLLEAYGPASPGFLADNPDAVRQYKTVLQRAGADSTVIPTDGSLVYGVDMAREKDYPWQIQIRKPEQHLNIVCFPCRAFTLTGLTDPRGYIPLKDLSILDSATLASPFQFGKSVTDSSWGDDAENMVTLWADPTIRVMLTLGLGFQEKRLILVKNSDEKPEGTGFVLEELKTIPSMVLQGAGDMWTLDKSRIAKLTANGVRNPRISQFHEQAGKHLEDARAALAANDYRTYRIQAERAWALEGKAYVETLAMINNMVRGVLFYLALLLPFSYCLERLLVASGTIKKRIIWICIIFSICFLVLSLVHPAFRFTMTPFLVLLAFIIIALVATVSVLIVSRMDAVLQERKRTTGGRHDESQNVGGIAVRAIDLGISNIRRRPQRAFLTGLTVVMVTFILLSFTSLVPTVSISKLRHREGVPTYRGMLIRDRAWQPLPYPLHLSIERTFREKGDTDSVVAARAWFFSDRSGNLSQIDLAPAPAQAGDPDDSEAQFTAVSLLCMQPSEPAVTGIDKVLLAGRWFADDDEEAIILPKHVAELLGFDPGNALGQRIRVFGQDLPVIGILDEEALNRIEDLDGEVLTPVDFVKQQELRARQQSDQRTADTLEKYEHYSSDRLVILPLRLGVRLGATIRSIAVRAGENLDLRQEAEGYTKRSNLTILACDGNDVTLYAALDTSQVSAAWQIVIPLFLGFIMVLGTMLGSVYERRREIFVYNSVGLAPSNVASLFLAESTVYAVIGAGMGYLLGQAVARLFQVTGWLSGLSLNYTAGSAVLVTALTMAIVLLSTVYPSMQAFHAAMPDVEKEGSDTEDQADEDETISFFLPFVATETHLGAMQAYITEFLASIEGVTVGQLAVDNLTCNTEEYRGATVPTVAFRAWLAPFDLGISQDVSLRIVFRPDRGVHQYHMTATRFSGDRQNWRRLLPRFILAIRKQLLMWRVLSPEELERYRTDGKRLFGMS